MSNVFYDLTLPEFAFLSSPELSGRNVVMHVRSVTAVEFFLSDDFVGRGGVVTVPFSRLDKLTGRMVEWVCVLHFSPLIDTEGDASMLRDIMSKAIMWFCDRLDATTLISGTR